MLRRLPVGLTSDAAAPPEQKPKGIEKLLCALQRRR